jgi:simple sugar transport system substrate-binding protein/ribose transport system substrate-binding protein
MKLHLPRRLLKGALSAIVLVTGIAVSLAYLAQAKGIDEPFRAGYKQALAGKTVAYVPVAMGFDLAQGWLEGLKKELEPIGVKIVTRDPNWNTNAGAQAITTLIEEKPDVMVIHNPDVQTYAKLLKKAEESGIPIVQINMRSNYPSVVFVGADWVEVGERDTLAVVDACKGKSNKIAIMQGALSAAASAYTLKGVENILAKHPEIKVVSSQAADWDASKAKGIAQTVLKQHPDLCGIVGFWDGMDIGTAAAIKEAGLTGKVFLATSGGGEQRGACDQVKAGAFDLDLSYDVPTQASNMAAVIKWLLQNPGKTGTAKGSIYTTLIPITHGNASVEGTCWKLGKI